MIKRLGLVMAAAVALGVTVAAMPMGADTRAGAGTRSASATRETYHYTMAVRVRPLLFWISRSNVGDAVVTRRVGQGAAEYSLLIGSAPDRAPRRINRWGYIDEAIRGDAATLVGIMSKSDEESLAEADAAVRTKAGEHLFKIIRATVEGGESRSVVSGLGTAEDYDLRQLQTVLTLAREAGDSGRMRTLRLPPGTRPGFLSALADLIHVEALRAGSTDALRPSRPRLTYVYHSRLYELRVKSAEVWPSASATSGYANAVAAEFENRSLQDGELTRFSITFAVDGALAEMPLTVSYRPRWWMQVDLALDDPAAQGADAAQPRVSRR